MMKEENSREININISQQEKIRSLREFVTSPEGQEEVVGFIENLKSEVGNKEGWINTCQKAEEESKGQPIISETVEQINQRFKIFIDQMPPGHDKGHFSRDLLTSILLFDSLKDKVAFQSEANAGLLGGAFHDIGTSIIPRYQDNKFGAGHGETGAFLFWQLSEGLLDENTRKLTAYSIASHTHYLKPIEVQTPQGYKKDKYWDNTWVDENGKLIGVAAQMTRRSDRSDTNGITHMFRHIIASMDAAETGGKDLSGDGWFELNSESLKETLNPVVRDPAGKPPSTLEHMYRFAKSNDGSNPYSEKDYLFPAFKELLALKLPHIDKLVETMDNSTEIITDSPENQKYLHDLFYKVSQADKNHFEKAWENFLNIWSTLAPESKSRWINGFKYAETAYNQILDYYQEKTQNTDFSNIATSLVLTLRQ